MAPAATRGLRLDQLLSRYGYCSRRDAARWLRDGRVTQDGIPLDDASERVDPGSVRIDGESVDAPGGLRVMLHKPAGFVCSRSDGEGPTVYELLPGRWSRRNPPVTTVGRLDRDTTGLLLLTDVGEWVHRWTSPRHHVEKTYEAHLDAPALEEWIGLFASGTLLLPDESKPCLPARLEVLDGTAARLHLTEGRFHQVKRMFAAVGRNVVRLHRSRFGSLSLGDLSEGSWREIGAGECP